MPTTTTGSARRLVARAVRHCSARQLYPCPANARIPYLGPGAVWEDTSHHCDPPAGRSPPRPHRSRNGRERQPSFLRNTREESTPVERRPGCVPPGVGDWRPLCARRHANSYFAARRPVRSGAQACVRRCLSRSRSLGRGQAEV